MWLPVYLFIFPVQFIILEEMIIGKGCGKGPCVPFTGKAEVLK
jgi:hypothetical protein